MANLRCVVVKIQNLNKKTKMGMLAPQKNERYAQLPCLNMKVMDYIFLKNKESGKNLFTWIFWCNNCVHLIVPLNAGVLGDLRNFRDVEIVCQLKSNH